MRSYLDESSASRYPALRALLDLDSPKVDDYTPGFLDLVESNLLGQLTSEILNDIPGHRARLDRSSAAASGWRLLLGRWFSLSARATTPSHPETPAASASAAPSLSTVANDALVAVVGSGQVEVDLYRSAFDRDDDVFDRKHRIELVGRRTMKGGDTFSLRASRDVAAFRHVEGSVVLLHLAMLDAKRIVWHYDPRTLFATHASSASVDATRMELALDLFKTFGDSRSADGVERVGRDSPHHWVRWKAVKTLLALDLQRGLLALRGATEDHHPHVRRAAAATLDNLRKARLTA